MATDSWGTMGEVVSSKTDLGMSSNKLPYNFEETRGY